MNRVLVTGARGFIGSRTLEPLVRHGFEVHAVSRGPLPEARQDVRWHAADLLDDRQREAVLERTRPSHLLHLAWFSAPGTFWMAPENAAWVAATVRLLEGFAQAGGARAVLAGTCAEYDWGAAQPFREDSPLMPRTFYGACKDATRRVAEGLAQIRGLSLAWGRVFFLYGPGEDSRRLVAGVARSLLAGQATPTTAGTQRRDFMHVDDAGGAFVALLESRVTGAVNLATGRAVPVRSVVEQLGDAAERPDLLELGALPPRPGEPDLLVADVDRLRREVGFEPTTALEDGLRSTLAWWRERRDVAGR